MYYEDDDYYDYFEEDEDDYSDIELISVLVTCVSCGNEFIFEMFTDECDEVDVPCPYCNHIHEDESRDKIINLYLMQVDEFEDEYNEYLDYECFVDDYDMVNDELDELEFEDSMDYYNY